jgi:predicted dinucleotide-binding enzyme
MKIAVLGTGNVGETIGSKLVELGHSVMMGSRTSSNEKAADFVAKHPGGKASAGTFSDAAAFGELVFLCVKGTEAVNTLSSAGEKNLDGKILIDISNPLDFSHGMPPSLSVCNTNSMAEEVQRAFPRVKVVKSLNTMWCGLMVNPGLVNGGDHTVFMSGDDDEAKKKVAAILESFGWKEENIIDLGGLATARGTEMYLPLWLSVYMSTNNGAFNLKIVR